MKERIFVVLIGFLGCCAQLAAEEASEPGAVLTLYRPEIFKTVDGSTLLHRLPVRAFLDGTRFPISSEIGRMGMTPPLNLPSLAYVSVTRSRKAKATPAHRADGKDFATDGKDASSEVVLSQVDPLRYGGEVGVFYGHASGKNGGDMFGSFIQSSVGTDKFQINVGASYQEWNGRGSRWTR